MRIRILPTRLYIYGFRIVTQCKRGKHLTNKVITTCAEDGLVHDSRIAMIGTLYGPRFVDTEAAMFCEREEVT